MMLRRWFLFALGAALAASLVLAPGAGADEVSAQAWATASDATLASLVSAPYTAQEWGGTSYASASIFDLADPSNSDDSVFNFVQAQTLASTLEAAGVASGGYVNPWGHVSSVPVTTAGTYISYKGGNLWFDWLDNDWGSVDTSTDICGSATGTSSQCELKAVTSGSSYCIGFNQVTGDMYKWTAPSDGLLLETTVQAYQGREAAGACSAGYAPLVVKANTGGQTTVETEYNADFELNSGKGNLLIWYEPAPGLESSTHTPPPSNAQPTTIAAYVGGAGQPDVSGDLTRYTTTPTNAQWANALRAELTDPSDTCNGLVCPWGDNGGAFPTTQTHTNSGTIDCILTGTCLSNSLICGYGHATVYLAFDQSHLAPSKLEGNSPVGPDGCWRWLDTRGKTAPTFITCSYDGDVPRNSRAKGTYIAYDDTSANHLDDLSVMETPPAAIPPSCIGGFPTIKVEFEAVDSCSDGGGGWVSRFPPGVNVVDLLQEVYCSTPPQDHDQSYWLSAASYAPHVGVIGNIGVDVPSTTDNGPCGDGYTTCLQTDMTNDIETICSVTTGIMGLYSNVPQLFGSTPSGQQQSADIASTINSALNECYH
jgi:hypothetical protein